jgi:hypothetical protein
MEFVLSIGPPGKLPKMREMQVWELHSKTKEQAIADALEYRDE